MTEMTQTQAVTKALILALIAPDDERSKAAGELADSLAAGLSDEEVEACKAAALQMSEGQRPCH